MTRVADRAADVAADADWIVASGGRRPVRRPSRLHPIT